MNLYDRSFAVRPVGCTTDQRLYPYQQAAVEQFSGGDRRHAILGHHPGAGKTPMGIQALKLAWENAEPAIVVCPPSIVSQWHGQIAKWLPPGAGKFITVVPDSMIHKRITGIVPGATVVIDECHRFKSRQSRRTRALFGGKYQDTKFPGITTGAKRIVALTGTPIIASPVDLFPLLRAMGFPDAKTFAGFCDQYCPPYQAPVYGGHMEWRYDRPQNLEILARKLRESVLIRPNRGEYLDQLPSLTFNSHHVSIPDPSEEYSEEEILNAMQHGDSEDVPLAVIRREVGERKALASCGFLSDLVDGGDRPVIWTWHRSVADMVAENLPGSVVVHGGQDISERAERVAAFCQGRAPAIIMSIASMGTGIDGLQHATDLCVFVEESFTPAENEQAVARLHRTGQKSPVRAIRITSNTTIDHVIRAANERKTTTAEGALQ